MLASDHDTGLQSEQGSFHLWSSLISSSLTALRQLAGSTEDEFLKIGSQMQQIYQTSTTLPQTAQRLVQLASGEKITPLIEQLSRILQEMESYFDQIQLQSSSSCSTLNKVENMLQQIVSPLEGFKKMSKNLYILEVFIKIESAYLGEISGEFVNLALDIKKLSQQIKTRANAIYDHRRLLTTMISRNIDGISSMNSEQEKNGLSTLNDAAASISQLTDVNQCFSQLGNTISTTSEENSKSISGVVQSMQIHDIFRQQVEHVIEALEGLEPVLERSYKSSGNLNDSDTAELIRKAGDICELQEAQLQFASAELHNAVSLIIESLSNIGEKQKLMVHDIISQSGLINTSGRSFIDDVGHQMSSINSLLATCANINKEVTGIMQEITATVAEITGSVTDIENISKEIIQIALNARIKASCTGTEGDSLSALAEEIGQVSTEAVQSTDTITTTLTQVHLTTETLTSETDSNEKDLRTRLQDLKTESENILDLLKDMSSELHSLLKQIRNQADHIDKEIVKIVSKINVHEQIKTKTDHVLNDLRKIFSEARKLYPASTSFQEDMKLMTQRYTMESERRIHETIAGLQEEKVEAATNSPIDDPQNASEFGDNIELF